MKSVNDILSGTQPRPVVIAHRGASHYHHQNTLGAFEAAVDMQSEMIEFDVRRTYDNVLVVHHDPDIDGDSISGMFHEEASKKASNCGYELATLSQALEYCMDKVSLDIELKEAGYEEEVLTEIMDVIGPEQFVITSAHDAVIRKARDLHADLKTGLIISGHPRWQLLNNLYPERRARKAGADLLVVSKELLKVGFLSTTKNLDLPVWIYTINDRKELWKMITDDRVAGIFSDRPDVALFLRDLYSVSKDKAMPPSIKVSE